MSYLIRHGNGREERDASVDRLGDLLDELDVADDEHPDVSITHESDWCLIFYRSGAVVLENLEEGEPRHLSSVDRVTAIYLMTALAEGKIGEVEKVRWQPGYPMQR